jgi:hypothetical protein
MLLDFNYIPSPGLHPAMFQGHYIIAYAVDDEYVYAVDSQETTIEKMKI